MEGEDRMQPMDLFGMRGRGGRGRRQASKLGAIVAGAAVLAAIVAVGAGATTTRRDRTESSAPSTSCQLGSGVKHVIELSSTTCISSGTTRTFRRTWR
jgi:hypothetical protein